MSTPTFRFDVTGLGLQIDGRMVMPGSKLFLNGKPPAAWKRFGSICRSVGSFEVATPKPDVDPDVDPDLDDEDNDADEDNDGDEDNDADGEELSLEELRERYVNETGTQPVKNWGVRKLKAELGIE